MPKNTDPVSDVADHKNTDPVSDVADQPAVTDAAPSPVADPIFTSLVSFPKNSDSAQYHAKEVVRGFAGLGVVAKVVDDAEAGCSHLAAVLA